MFDARVGYRLHSSSCLSGIDNNTFARWKLLDPHVFHLVLLGDERRHVRLEPSSAHAHDDDCNDEACQSTVRLLDDPGNTGDYEEDVADDRDADRDADGLVAAPSCIRNVCAKERDDIHPGDHSVRSQRLTVTCMTYQKVLKVPIPVEARCPRPSAPACLMFAPVREPGGRGC